MKAAITQKPGGPTQIVYTDVEKPKPKTGHVLIQVKAFGLNRSELFTRRGDSPGVEFPRIQGIECVGIVDEDIDGVYQKGQKVMALMGGMGRFFDGGYAEYTLIPHSSVFAFDSSLSWETLGAIPEMFQTVSGSLHQALELQKDEVLLIRGGTSSIGMLACQLAKVIGAEVVSTTRNEKKSQTLRSNGADKVIIDNGEIHQKLREEYSNGVDKVLELIGTQTLKDSLKCIRTKGTVCMTGILGNSWSFDHFEPMGDIPSLGRLTVYMGEASNINTSMLHEFIQAVEKGEIKLNIDKVYSLNEVAEAHQYMEDNKAKGKIVVVL
ncbi:zinc-binding alcohol dehydrogenase family protein [Flammeovirga sp. SubArs3]|uniref:zinc-binding alcohol dehydrogenase family protein n=1 Tax=Flammeovirga sp. SubArs3 TaxID=2995316 RepID=UPI00248C192E|nr:zinc-binding alcohol dehydrogenase family protein [Flammeovirga sp. SubArs3]